MDSILFEEPLHFVHSFLFDRFYFVFLAENGVYLVIELVHFSLNAKGDKNKPLFTENIVLK